jgi:calcineurin-like phosphoesterase family protein
MDQVLVERWNQTVKPNDKIYVLGDVAMRSKHMHVMSQLHGDKVLIKGNHDIFKMKEYATYFRDIRAYHVMNGCLLSHIPIHPASMGRFGCNIHGHLHYREVTTDQDQIDPRYICVSVEHTNYAPILFEEVCQRIVDRGGQVGFRATGDAAL